MSASAQEKGAYTRYRVLAVNDEKDHCQCCGRTGLKRVVWIEDLESDTVQHFGTVCALHPAKAFGLKREIDAAIQQFTNQQKAITACAHIEYRKRGGKYVRKDEFTMTPADCVLFASMKQLVAERVCR